MTAHSGADAIYRFADIDGNLIEIAKRITAYFIRQSAHCSASKIHVYRHRLLRCYQFLRVSRRQDRFEDGRGDVAHDGNANTIAADMVSVVVSRRQLITDVHPHQTSR